MGRTFFHDFETDSGKRVTVEYSASGGEPNADLPGHICDGGGSGPEIVIVDCWPNDEAYEDLSRRRNERAYESQRSRYDRFCKWVLEVRMTLATLRRAWLTLEELEWIEAWLAEHYVEEYDEPEYEGWRS